MIDVVLLAEFLEGKLNANTEGLKFRTYTYEKTLDRRYDNEEGTNANFIPSIITTPMGSYMPINAMRGSRLSFNLEILLPVSDKYSWIDMVNDFVWSINGKVFYQHGTTITEAKVSGVTNITIKMTCQVPSFGSVSAQNFELMNQIASYLPIRKTENYVGINIPINLKTIDGFAVGDQAKVELAEITSAFWEASTYAIFTAQSSGEKLVVTSNTFATLADFISWLNSNHLYSETYAVAQASNSGGTVMHYAQNAYHKNIRAYTQIKTTDFTVKNARVPMTEHFEGETTGQTFIRENDVKYIMTAYYEDTPVLNHILTNIHQGSNQNQLYWLKVTYPAYTSTITLYTKVVVYDQAVVFPIDDFALLPLVFVKAWSD